MSFSESELVAIDSTVGELCRRNSPAHVADKIRCTFEVDGHAVTIFEEVPDWQDDSAPWMRTSVARLRYYRSRQEWTLYWMPSDMQWHAYEPADRVHDLGALVDIIEQDTYCAFFG